MCFLKKLLTFLIISLLWLSSTACKAKAECECHHESAVDFVQIYYADLQEERTDRISLALDRWYPNRLPNDKLFIKQLEEIQYVRSKAEVSSCWQESRSILSVNVEMKTRDRSELSKTTGLFYLKCTSEGWKIFLAQRESESLNKD